MMTWFHLDRRKLAVYIMKCSTTILALILTLQVIYTDSFQECPKDHFIIIDKNGKINCVLCATCAVGRGLRIPCGTKLTEAQRANIECLPCEPGKTYSDQHGPSSCKSCQICPVTLKNCTAESNTQCTKDCGRGLYYDNSTYNCQPCSYCCRKDNSRLAECADLPAQSQCSVHDAVECSPKTTKNPTSVNHGSSGDNQALKTTVIVIAVVACVLVAVLIVICLSHLLKHKRKRPNEQPEAAVLYRNGTDNCGLSKSSFFIVVQPPGEHGIQEGKEISLICKNQVNDQEESCPNNCKYIYDWKKDTMGLDPPCHLKEYKINKVKVRDFGKYTCEVKCRQHPKQSPVKTIESDLEVVPEPPRRYKKFKEIESLEVYDKIADMLKSPATGIGEWKRVAEKYGMDALKIRTLESEEKRGKQVVEYLLASQTNLNVYDFCNFMKILKQNQIVELLINKDQLTCKEQAEKRQVDVRDSGYYPDFNGIQSPTSLNNPGLIDSRQGSRDQLAGTSQNGKENPDKSNKKLERQISNQSARSSGSNSGSASNSLMRGVKGIARQISQNSSYKKVHENEDGDPS